MTDGWDGPALARSLGVRAVVHPVVSSTMNAAREDAGEVPSIHIADRQLSGRGRRGRHWESPPGNLHATIVWPDPERLLPPATLAALQVAWVESIVAAGGPRARCKWPNDGFIAERKWAGMLAARSAQGARLSIGVGANLVAAPADRAIAATTLAAHWDAWPGRLAAATLLLGAALEVLRDGPDGVAARLARWSDHDIWPAGTIVEVATGSGVIRGSHAGISVSGALRLRTAEGAMEISSGDAHRVRACDRP